MLGNNYSTLTSKTQIIVKILGMQQQMNDNFEEYGAPFEIDAQGEAPADRFNEGLTARKEKRASIKMFNVLTAVIAQARRWTLSRGLTAHICWSQDMGHQTTQADVRKPGGSGPWLVLSQRAGPNQQPGAH
eukprot:6462015-Prymnesium_polylepis.2